MLFRSWTFGPYLIKDSIIRDDSPGGNRFTNWFEPRVAIGMIEPLHYIFIVADGRYKVNGHELSGMSLQQLAQIFREQGCKVGYNLDGGGSSTLIFNNKRLNKVNESGKEREISDCIVIMP